MNKWCGKLWEADATEGVPKSDMFEIDADDQHTVQQVVQGPMRLKVYMGQINPEK